MRVLVACEFSGVVRDAFSAAGHEAWSCDIIPTESPGSHFLCDIKEVIHLNWDLMIAHPPCTYLCSSGARWWKDRRREQEAAFEFVMMLANAQIDQIAIENPIGCLSSRWRKPNQIIQPWQFGHPESKSTCLWLKGLLPLKPTNILPRPESGRWNNQTPSGQNKLGPAKDRAKERARTYPGIAQAMANQWGTNPHPPTSL